ncbi:MAG: recombinase RecA [Candidatus Pacebacteria bacterium]|nr:recombinase RecA [Candidatus Paceibacterota bacterium]MDD5721974.1 recombinase RecA [Candidatus Paceibacterota bacterium]
MAKKSLKTTKSKLENKGTKEDQVLEQTLKDLQDKFGEGAIMKLGGVKKVNVDVIPTGSPSLDLALGVGGIPRGRITEIYGAESSGKTTLVLHIVAEVQKKGGKAAFIDSEHALDPDYAQKIGVKVKDLLISQPDNGEQALDIVESLVRSGVINLIIVDSVAALTPQAEIEGEMGDQTIGLQARLMSRALRKLTGIAAKTNTAIIFTNQTRMQIGMVMFGNPTTTPGGKALKFYSSVRIELRRTAQIKKSEEIIGSRIKVKVVKNKVAPPFRETEFDILYNEGISFSGDLLNLGLKKEIVKKSGLTFSFGDIKLGVGFEVARNFLKENPKIAKNLWQQIIKT